MAKPKKVVLDERELESSAEAHRLLSESLGFERHYGANLDALEDCLDEVARPTRIVVVRDVDAPKPWFDGFVEVIGDCALRSCYLGMSLRARGGAAHMV